MSLIQKVQVGVAGALLVFSVIGAFMLVNLSPVVWGVFPVALGLLWVYLVSAVVLIAGALMEGRFEFFVSVWMGLLYAVMALWGVFMVSLPGVPLDGGNRWLHLLVALLLLFSWMFQPSGSEAEQPPKQPVG